MATLAERDTIPAATLHQVVRSLKVELGVRTVEHPTIKRERSAVVTLATTELTASMAPETTSTVPTATTLNLIPNTMIVTVTVISRRVSQTLKLQTMKSSKERPPVPQKYTAGPSDSFLALTPPKPFVADK